MRHPKKQPEKRTSTILYYNLIIVVFEAHLFINKKQNMYIIRNIFISN